MERVPVFILAGGRSSRFDGADKARLLLAGEPLILHVVAALSPLATRITVVADAADKYADLGLRTIVDRSPGLGPLAGLQAALQDAPDRWVLVAGCDWAGLRTGSVRLLLEPLDDGVPAVAFREALWQPLLAAYHGRLEDEVSARLEQKRLAAWRLLEECGARALPLPPGWAALQVNSPEDLARAERLTRSGAAL